MSKFIVFESTPEAVWRRGEYECDDFVPACELMLASFKLTRYNKAQRSEPLGTFHMIDVAAKEFHYIRVEGEHSLAVVKLEPTDAGPVPWLTDPFTAFIRDEIEKEKEELEDENNELKDTVEEQKREMEKLEEKLATANDVISSASQDIAQARSALSPPDSQFDVNDVKREMTSRIESAVNQIIEDLMPNFPDLDEIDNDLQSIESDLDNADI